MEKRDVRVTRVSMGMLALLEAWLAAEVGLALSIAAWITTANGSTSLVNLVLRGMTFGLHPGLGAVILCTIYYFIAGLVFGYVNAALFNMVVNWMGSAEVGTRELDDDEVRAQAGPGVRPRRPEPTFGETVDHRRMDR